MSEPAAAPLFELAAVRFGYQEVAALDGLSLALEAGARVALLGANGSGKSTLLRLLDGLDFPHSGEVRFQGRPLTAERLADDDFAFDFRRRVGLVFQHSDVQLFNPTVFDELAFGPLQLGWARERIRARVEEMLEAMGLGALGDRPPHHLSGGEKRRVALASVLILEPEVLLLDEPTAMLDPRSESGIIDLLAGWAGGGRTAVTATNDLDLIADIADRCVVLRQGRVAADGTPGEIVRDRAMLEECGLLRAHRHVHESGEVHSHPHLHRRHDHA
jgi:cobalt/nickel transport system ATP-binding protein